MLTMCNLGFAGQQQQPIALYLLLKQPVCIERIMDRIEFVYLESAVAQVIFQGNDREQK